MSAPRWTLSGSAGRTLMDRDVPVFFLSVAVGNELTNPSLRAYAQRIVHLLNAFDSAEVIPRRPLIAAKPDGYMESDQDYVLNNLDACVRWLDSAILR